MNRSAVTRALALGAAFGALVLCTAQAETFRYSLKGPVLTMDPHSSADFLTQSVLANIYDPLVQRDQNLELVPGLAERWEEQDATTWRFWLRQGVKFHEGQDFTAEDVRFSIERAKPGGMFTQYLGGIVAVNIVDDHTIDFVTAAPDPLLPRWLSIVLIMDEEWATEHESVTVPDLAKSEEMYSVRNTNGTGMFLLQENEQGVRTVMERNPDWWGETDSNVTTAIYLPIGSAPTRVAALLSGEVDLVGDLPLQDIDRVAASPDLKVLQKPELRMVQLEMSPFRDQALDVWDHAGNPLPENPWRDVRVRQAVAYAVNKEQIVERVMRGYAYPLAMPSIQGIGGYQPDLDVSLPYDVDKAKALLAEAGYPDGFKATLLCPNDRYVNDEAICRAISAMLARVGIDAPVDAQPWANYVQKLINLETDFHLVGAAPNGQDTFDMLQGTWMTREGNNGFYNWSRWSSPAFDNAVEGLKVEFDPDKRRELYREALTIARDEIAAVFLHSQVIVWGLKKNIDAEIRQDSYVMLRWVKIN